VGPVLVWSGSARQADPGQSRQGGSLLGSAWHGRLGGEWCSVAGQCRAALGRLGGACPGKVGRGYVRHGMVRQGAACYGVVWSSMAWFVQARLGRLGAARCGAVRQGAAMRSMAWLRLVTARPDVAWQRSARQARHRLSRPGVACHREAWHRVGLARQARSGLAWRRGFVLGWSRRGWVRFGTAGQARIGRSRRGYARQGRVGWGTAWSGNR